MRNTLTIAMAICGIVLFTRSSSAQPREPGPGNQPGPASPFTRIMSFDKNGDGNLTKEEVTDERLLRLFERGDANADGVLSSDEITKMQSDAGRGMQGAGGFGGQGGFGGRGGRGAGGFGGPAQPGQVLAPFAQDALNLTMEQKAAIEALQAEVDRKLAEILTDDQKQQLAEMRARGPGRGGPGGGPGNGGPGAGGPGGGERPGAGNNNRPPQPPAR